MGAFVLAGKPTAFVNADVALDGEPIVGSFTVDGMTFALSGDDATLVAVAPGASGPSAIPSTVAYGDVSYDVVAIGAYAFYLSGATEVALPTTVSSVDERAFRSSDVAWVEVDPANRSYASYDGCLYGADLLRLLLIPGGRQGAVRISDKAEGVESPAFSHCAGVDAVSVDAGSASFASWDGLLYDADGTTLLRVPAGAAAITIREGCTAIAAGAMEGCAKLETIDAPSTVASISPDVFSQETPTVALPAFALIVGNQDEDAADNQLANQPDPTQESSAEDEGATSEAALQGAAEEAATHASPQLTAVVAIGVSDDDVPKVDPSSIRIELPAGSFLDLWLKRGFDVVSEGAGAAESANRQKADALEDEVLSAPLATLGSAQSYNSFLGTVTFNGNGANLMHVVHGGTTSVAPSFSVNCYGSNWAAFANGSLHYYTSDSATAASVISLHNRAGYTYTGLTGTINLPAGDGSYIGRSSATLTAQWRANTITTTWDCRGGNIDGSMGPFTRSATYAESAKLGDTWTFWVGSSRIGRAGYTFAGWYTAASGGYQVLSDTALPPVNTTYFAHWDANTITCYWNSQGGSAIGNTSRLYSNTAKVPMPSTNPTRAGYTFAGWYTAASGGTQVTSNTTLPTSNPTYHAHWNANAITCYWNSQGGSAIGNTSSVYSSTAKVPMPSTNPTRAGYTFAGWYTAASGGTQVTSSTALPTSNTTYHAHWSANTVTLAWDAHGGTAVSNTSATYSPSAKVPMPAATTRAGWTFAGWWTSETGGTQVTSSTALPTSNQTYHARWSKNSYRIDCDYAGGSASNPTTYDVETATFTLRNPTRLGFVFTGWSGTGLTGDANMTVTIAKGSTGDRSYAAHWLPALSVDVPMEVTAKVDLLGVEEPTEATGYIESRSGGSLKVAEVAFAPLAGAAELFGSRTPDVFLEAFAEGSAAADVSFALNAAATETDSAKLAPFALPDGYGTRIGVGYRFAIPDDALAAIDPNRFTEVTTPVGQVVYTVALAE